MQEILSARAYAKHRGITVASVVQAINEGRLPKSAQKVGSGYKIDRDLADHEWKRNTDSGSGWPAQMRNQVEASGSEPISYAEARAQHETFKARLAQLELEEREGKLVEAEAAKREAFRVARLVRDAMLNIPDRVAAELAAETNQFKVHQRLTHEIRRALEDLKLE